ncbi:hydrophobin 2 [Boletus coccyginus]|nr:hydrophobin 2 [Boletus coccyginus]
MFSRLATLVPIAALVAVATAAPGVVVTRDSFSQCNTDGQYCCNQSIEQNTSVLSGILGAAEGLNLAGGATCSPVSVVGVSGNSCTQQPVCCSNNNFNGLINLGCSPININL